MPPIGAILASRWTWAAAALLAFGLWLFFHDRGVIAEHEQKIEAQVAATSSAAAENARAAVDQSRNEVEKSNDDARKAAAGGSDPLKSGLDSLRGTPASKPAPR